MHRQKLRILFDATTLADDKKSGVGYYTAGLITALAAVDPDHVELIGHYFDLVGKGRPSLPQASNIRYRVSKLLPKQFANIVRRKSLPLPYELLTKTRPDFILFPAFIGRTGLFNIPSASIIHDLAYLDLPETVSAVNRADLERFVPKTLRHNAFTITISEATRAQIRHHYPWYDADLLITHIPPPPAAPPANAAKILEHLHIEKPYMLFVGTLEPRKNVTALIEAYGLLPESLRGQFSLVLAGGEGWNNSQITLALSVARAAGHDIITPGYITDEQRAALYSKATLFVSASHYEGFGMPVLEAMSYGVPTVISDLPVFHEVAGKAALYFDKDDAGSIAQTLETVLTDKILRKNLVLKGKENLRRFDWDKIAREVLARIEQSVQSSK